MTDRIERWMTTFQETMRTFTARLETDKRERDQMVSMLQRIEQYEKDIREGFMRLNGNVDRQFQMMMAWMLKGRSQDGEVNGFDATTEGV